MKRGSRVILVFMIALTMTCSSVVFPYADTAAGPDAGVETGVDVVTDADTEPDPDTEEGTETDAEAAPDAELLKEVGTHGIPVLYVHVDESGTTIDEMNADLNHKTECTGTVDIKVPEDCTDAFGQASYGDQEGLVLKFIRGRGNSTWADDKKPYKLKFKEDQNFFGMGSDKEWALMANYKDDTFLKNIMTAWLGEQLGFDYSPAGVPVELVMTGDKYGTHYLGCYVLSELVNRGTDRVNIEKLGKKVSAKEEEAAAGEANISGGYLLSLFNENQDWDEHPNNVFKTGSGVEWLLQEPDYEPEDAGTELTDGQKAQLDYIHSYMQELEDLIMAASIDHDAVAEKMDLQSAADYWMIQEFCKNDDAFQTHSTYLYKPRGGKLHWGPLWDFDLAWPTDGYTSVSGLNKTMMIWLDHLRAKDPAFRALIEERWGVLKGKLEALIADGGILDQYEAGLSKAWAANHELWPDIDENDQTISYHERIERLKDYIQKRIEAFNKGIENDLDKVFATVTFMADGEVVAVYDDVRLDGDLDRIPEPPDKEGYVFGGWYDEKTGEIPDLITIDGDLTFVAKYIPESEAVAPKDLFMREYVDWVAIQDYAYPLPYTQVTPDNVTDTRVKYTVSDESVATIHGEELRLLSTGDVVIKASTYNGVSKELTLHVYDNTQIEEQPVTAMKPEATSYKMAKGEVKQLLFDLYPKDVPLDYQFFEFRSSDDSIAEIDYMGVVKAHKAGTVTIKYSVWDINDNMGGSGTLKITVMKSANPIKVKAKSKVINVRYKKLRKRAQTIKRSKAITISKSKGKLTYKLVSVNKSKYKKYFKINKKTGKITIRKRLRKGTYTLRIKVSDAGTSQYKAARKYVKVKIRVR